MQGVEIREKDKLQSRRMKAEKQIKKRNRENLVKNERMWKRERNKILEKNGCLKENIVER